ncbi:MAG: 6-hydroxymethylpterin diphosphokinase MptE-like protein [Candidatus Bathyarchaeota archaeon]
MSEPKMDGETYLSTRDMENHRRAYATLLKTDDLEQIHLSNFLWNMPILKNYPGILGFEGVFKNVPAILIGAGPSLEKNMHLLKEASKKALLFCGDAALPILVKKLGIYPHFVIMGDPTEKQAENFKDIDTTKFMTVAATVCNPSIFRVVEPRHLCVYNVRSDSILGGLIPYHTGRKGGLPAGVLTTGSVFGFAAMTGASPITFIGQDMSWPTPDKVYTDGVVQGKHSYQKVVKFKSECALFPDINGKLVLTHSTFINFYIWLKDCLPRVKVNLFNSSEAGILKMKLIKVLPLKKWLDRYCKYELVGIPERIAGAFNYQCADGMIEKLLLPPLRAAK